MENFIIDKLKLRYTAVTAYPFISHLSFSKPLWMDCAMEDSIRST